MKGLKMNQKERRIYLIRELLKEKEETWNEGIGETHLIILDNYQKL